METKRKKIRVSTLREMKASGEKFVMVTAYDSLTASIAEEAEMEVILVGDSLGMTALGLRTTLKITLDMMIHHAGAVARGAKSALLVGDMPFMTYKISPEQALANAARMIAEGSMEAVKFEGGSEVAPMVSRLVEAGIPVMGHVGLLPQSYHAQGGFRVQGREEGDRERLLADAMALDEAGVFALVLEALPTPIADEITSTISAPTIGIGAGKGCDAQVLVFSDLLGLGKRRLPKFARQYADLRTEAVKGLKNFADDVRSGEFPGAENIYTE